MTHSRADFWCWFNSVTPAIAKRGLSDDLQDEILLKIQKLDKRLFFMASMNVDPKELIITAEGNQNAFESAIQLVATAPVIEGWDIIALKPAMGFAFRHEDGPISLQASDLWFLPLKSPSDPSLLGISLGFTDADFVLANQSIDTAYTIIETGIGEKTCATEIDHISVGTLPEHPDQNGYIEIEELPNYIEYHNRKYRVGGRNI